MTLLPLGDHLSAVRIPGVLVHAAVGSDEPSVIADCLAERLQGPVIHDPGFDRYYALVLSSTGPVCVPPGAEYLGSGTFLGVPRTDCTELNKGTLASYWAVPVSRPGALCALADVCEFALLGRTLTNGEAES